MPCFQHTFRHCCAILAAGVGAITCCLLVGCGGAEVPSVKADALQTTILVRKFDNQKSATGGSAAERVDPNGFATLSGRFKVKGTPNELPNLATTGNDRAYCGAVPDNTILVDDEGNLQNVLVFLSTKLPKDAESRYGLWIHESYQAAESALLEGAAAFDQQNCSFKSRIFAMRATQTVQVMNSDRVGHNTNIAGSGRAMAINPTLPAGSAIPYAPAGASTEPYPVSCSVHSWMKSWMISLDSPYFAVTGADGAFEIPNLPAGVELTFSVWHEKAKWLKNVAISTEKTTDRRGRFPLKLEAGEDQQIVVELDAALLN